jgi:Flp pilus assembly protein TadG
MTNHPDQPRWPIRGVFALSSLPAGRVRHTRPTGVPLGEAARGRGGRERDDVHEARGRRRDDDGAVAVEFAILVIPLVMIVFAIMHFGMWLAQEASIASAVRSGARYGSVNLYAAAAGDPEHSCSEVVDRTREAITTFGADPATATIEVFVAASDDALGSPVCTGDAPTSTPPCDGSADTDTLYVRASYTSQMIGIPFTSVGESANIEALGAYRCEYN